MAMHLLLSAFPILIIIFLFFFTKTQQSRRRAPRRPPGPKGLPFIGNIHQVDTSKLHIWLTENSRKYGPLLYLKFCRVPVVVISSAGTAEKALRNNDAAFAGRPITSVWMRLSYNRSDIISSPYSDYWRKMRKMVVHHLFSPQKVRSFRPIREEEVSSMIAWVASKADSCEAIDVGEALSSFTRNILCRVAFGKKSDQGVSQSWRSLEKIVIQLMASLVETFLPDTVAFGWINKLTGAARRVERLFEEMDSFYQQLIDEHLDPDRPDSMNGDVLDLLIQLRADNSAAVKIDWEHMKAILMNLFVAGTDTTMVSSLWAMTALIKNPNIMRRVQHEIRSFVGKKGSVDEDDIEKLPYLKAVVKETLRLYPPVPLVPKKMIDSCIIDGYEIQAKTCVIVNIWAIGRDREYWENADEFFPERFLNTRSDFKGQEFGFIPFGSGRRICPGNSLAVASMELALANLLYFFDWKIPHGKTEEDIDTDASTGIALYKKNPLYLLAKTYIV